MQFFEDLLVLVSEGDEIFCHDLKSRLLNHKCKVIEAVESRKVIQLVRDEMPDLIFISSSQRAPRDCLILAERIRDFDANIYIILISMQSSESFLISAMRAGINDFLKMPFSSRGLISSIEHALRSRRKPQEILVKDNMIGSSFKLQRVKTQLLNIALTESTVLITGETGTGKELAAHIIHSNSERKKKPFVCIDCAALTESLMESELFGHERGAFTGAASTYSGKLKLAEGGTVFLDEIGELSISAQAKILRVIELKEFYRVGGRKKIPLDVRFITATNQELEKLVEEKKFRKDLFYRLNVARVHMPKLAERREDIPELLAYWINVLNKKFRRKVRGLSKEVLRSLVQYEWPGNVRELQNMLEAVFINTNSNQISVKHFPASISNASLKFRSHILKERDRIITALISTNWNKSKAAEKLHWSRMTLYRKIEKYNINKEIQLSA